MLDLLPGLDLTGIEDLKVDDSSSPDLQSQQDEQKKEEVPSLDLTGIDEIGKTSFSRPAKIPASSSNKGGKVRSGYGYRKNPITGKDEFHDGIDIPLPLNTPIKPFGIGTVVFAGKRGNYGNSIGVDYGNGLIIYTNHLARTTAELGDQVRPETIVGYSGNTGLSTGPHTHIQAIKDGTSINPYRVFANDPQTDGINLTLKDGIGDEEPANLAVPDLDLTGLENVDIPPLSTLPQKETAPPLDLAGTENITEDTKINENNQIDSDVVKFIPKVKADIDSEAAKPFYSQQLTLERMAKGIGALNKQTITPRVQNPNQAGRPISLIVKTKDGKPPTQQDINAASIENLGIVDLNEKFKKDLRKRFGSQIIAGQDDILDIVGARYTKLPNGSYKVDLPYGHSSGVVDQINAYARGGLDAFITKQEDLKRQAEVYKNDIAELQARKKALIENHPYISKIIESATEGHGEDLKAGFQGGALKQIQFLQNISSLTNAIWTIERYGSDTPQYYDAVRAELKTQQAINEAHTKIPEARDFTGKVIRGGIETLMDLPKLVAASSFGPAGLITVGFLDNIHKGPRQAILGTIPLIAMAGGGHGLSEFIESGGNPLDIVKKSINANDDYITTIFKDVPQNEGYIFPNNPAFPFKSIEYSPLTPIQRQLIMRGSNALFVGVPSAIESGFNLQETASSLLIGAAFPVGKGRKGEFGRFERPSIITGDAYTLPNGSVLVSAPQIEKPYIDKSINIFGKKLDLGIGGLIQGRIPEEGSIKYQPSIIEQEAPKGFVWGKQLKAGKVEIPAIKSTKATLLDIDQAALNLIDLRRMYEQGAYLDKAQKGNLLTKAVDETQRRTDLLTAIKVLDEAVPKDVQDYFEKNELAIREAINTNYESRIKKEEFIKGQKILRKPNAQLSMNDVRPFDSASGKTATDNFMQRARRTMVSVEEAGKRGLEANKRNKGSFNMGLDPSDIPYLVQIGIGKLGRKGLDAIEFIREMTVEHGEDFKKYGMEVYKQARNFVAGVNSLANIIPSKTDTFFAGDYKKSIFPVADIAAINNVYYISARYLGEAKEEDIPLNKVIATQDKLRTKALFKFGENPNIALLAGKIDAVGNPDVSKAVKINDNYYLFDGHHRSSTEKIRGNETIRGRVIDLNEIATNTNKISPRIERAKEVFGETGVRNKWFTQEKQMEVRDNFLKPPDSSELQEGVSGSAKWLAKNTSSLIQIMGFHVEDLYRRGIEPKLSEVLNRMRVEFGNWIDSIDIEDWRKIFNDADIFYKTNNADSFFSGLKQNVLERFPEGNINAQSARGIIEKLGTKNEIEWTSGLNEWIKGKIKNKEKISKKELLEVIENGQVKVDETVLGNLLTNQERYRLDELKTRELNVDLSAEEGIEYQRLINKANNSETRYDLKSYTAEKLELEGGRNPKEVLLKASAHLPKESKEAWNNFKNFAEKLDDKYNAEDRNTKDIEEYANLEDVLEYNRLRSLMQEETRNNLTAQGVGVDMYQTPHWSGVNIVAHFRANERETTDGLSVFHSEEFQSDWNQELRKRLAQEKKGANIETSDFPINPFMENNWKELSFKRFLRMGIEMGKDGVSWTTSRQQQERYNKIIQTKDIRTQVNNDGTYNLEYKTEHGNYVRVPEANAISKEKLRDYVGPELADKITNQSIIKTTIDDYRSEKYAIVHNFETNGYDIRLRDSRGYIDMSPKALHNFNTKQEALNKLIELDPSATPIYEEGQQYLYASGKDITISKGYSDYDTYFVNLAKKIAKRFGAEYKTKEIETSENRNQIAAILIPFSNSITGENGFAWETLNEKKLSSDFKTREEAIANKPEGDYFYIDDAYRSIEGLNPKRIEQVHYLEINDAMRDSLLKEGQPLYGLSDTSELKPSSPFGTHNRIITRDIFDSIKESLLKSLQEETGNSETSSRTVFNSGLNPDAFLDQIKLLYKGWQDFSTFSSSLIRKYGSKIEPHIQAIWNWLQDSARILNEDERGFISFGKKKSLYKGDELDIFESAKSSLTKRISYKVHRGIALAQTYEPFGQVYQTLRGLQRTTNAYSTTILEQLTRSVSLLREDTDQLVAKAILARDREQINDPTEDANIVKRFGLNQEQTQAFYYERAAVSNVLDLRRDSLLYKEYRNVNKLNNDLAGEVPGTKEHDAILEKLLDADEKIQKIETYYQGLKDSGYISRQRLGRFRAELENPNFPIDDPNHFLVDYADSAEEAQKRINEWKEQYNLQGTGKILDAHKPGDFKELSRNLTPGDFEELVAGSGVSSSSPDVESLRAEVYEKFPSMGYQLKRKFYPGHPETNEFIIKSIAHQAEVYSSSYYNNIGREEGLRSLEATGLEKSDPDLWNVARQYIEDETSTPRYNLADRAAFKARKFTYMMQLAYDIKQLYLNMFIQPVTQNYSYLARVENPLTGKRLKGIDIEKTFIGGTKLALRLAKAAIEERFGKKTLKDAEFNEFNDIYNQLKAERVIEPEFNKSLLELQAERIGDIDSKFQSKTKRFFSRRQQEHWAGAFMRAGELGTRTQMAASLFLAGKKFGLSGDALLDFIVKGVDATQTNPTRGENPYLVRQAGEVGKLFYQFGAFRHMWFENLVLNAKSDWAHNSVAATSRTLAPLAIMSGIGGLPLSGFAFTLYSLATGRNPNEEVKKWVKNKIADNNWLENASLYGVTGNASFSQSTGINAPVVDNATDQLTQDNLIDKIFSSNIPALLTAKQIATGFTGIISGAYHEKPKEVLRGIEEASPKFIRMPLRAERVIREGYRTNQGHVIYSKKKITVPEQLGQAVLGITPNKVIEEYEDNKYKKLRRSSIGKASRRFYKKLTQ